MITPTTTDNARYAQRLAEEARFNGILTEVEGKIRQLELRGGTGFAVYLNVNDDRRFSTRLAEVYTTAGWRVRRNTAGEIIFTLP